MKKEPIFISILGSTLTTAVFLSGEPPSRNRDPVLEHLERLNVEERQGMERRVAERNALPAEEREARLNQGRMNTEISALGAGETIRKSSLSVEERMSEMAELRQWYKAQLSRVPPVAEGPPGPRPEHPIDEWEFRGSVLLGDGRQFSLHNPWEDSSFWIGAGETRDGVSVTGFDEEKGALHVQQGDEKRVLHVAASAVHTGADAHTQADPARERQRETFARVYDKWTKAVENSEELQDLQKDLSIPGEALEALLEEAYKLQYTPGSFHRRQDVSAEIAVLITQAREAHERIVGKLQQHPLFDEDDIQEAKMMAVPMALGRYLPYPLY